jgi:hypothetical protein
MLKLAHETQKCTLQRKRKASDLKASSMGKIIGKSRKSKNEKQMEHISSKELSNNTVEKMVVFL